jgi:hypothetical protein
MAVASGYSMVCHGSGPGRVSPLASFTVVGAKPGHSLCYELVEPRGSDRFPSVTLYSAGPDGRDDHGGGDDVVPSEGECVFACLLLISRPVLVTVAVLVGWMAWGPFALRPRGRLRTEAWRALVLASGPASLPFATLAAIWGWDHLGLVLRDLVWSPRQDGKLSSLVPLRVAFPVTWALVF